jgi:hypothetical protein
VDERFELVLIDMVGDFPKNVTLSFTANTPLKICLVASNVNPFCNQKLENPWLPLFFLNVI